MTATSNRVASRIDKGRTNAKPNRGTDDTGARFARRWAARRSGGHGVRPLDPVAAAATQDVRTDATSEDPTDSADALGPGRHGGRPGC
jgi:hypothetical protein